MSPRMSRPLNRFDSVLAAGDSVVIVVAAVGFVGLLVIDVAAVAVGVGLDYCCLK